MKASKELTLIEKTSPYWFLVVVIFSGLAVLYLGFNPTLGGVLVGSGVGAILAKLVGERLEQQVEQIDHKLDNILQRHETNISQLYLNITDVLSKTVNFPWTTDEKKLKNHRVCMHEYYRTRNSHEEFWIYRQLDFSKYFAPGRLYTRQIIFMDDKEYEYELDGFLIDIRLVITVKPTVHTEDMGISIYRDYCSGLHRESGYCGLSLHNDWDGEDGWDPCFLTYKPLFGIEQQGRQVSEVCEKLTEHWIKLAPKVGISTA